MKGNTLYQWKQRQEENINSDSSNISNKWRINLNGTIRNNRKVRSTLAWISNLTYLECRAKLSMTHFRRLNKNSIIKINKNLFWAIISFHQTLTLYLMLIILVNSRTLIISHQLTTKLYKRAWMFFGHHNWKKHPLKKMTQM
jgi:hypothetical protein